MFRLRTLGSVELEGASGPQADAVTRGPKRLALLVYLAIDPPRGFKRRDALAALLWPELDQQRARHALRNTLHELRKALGDGALASRGSEEVGLSAEALWCDVVAFDETLAAGRREEALALYRGPFLEGFHVPGAAPEFEHWVNRQRDRLTVSHAAALEALAEDREAREDFRAAAEQWRLLLAHHPWNGRVVFRLMHALEAAGDRAEALRRADAYRARLREELAAEPDPEVAALAARLRQAPSRAPDRNDTPQGAAASNGARPPASAATRASIDWTELAPHEADGQPSGRARTAPSSLVADAGRSGSASASPPVRILLEAASGLARHGGRSAGMPRTWRVRGAVAALLLAAGAFGTLVWRQASRPQAERTNARSEASIRPSSLAVLPLKNYSGDPAQDDFAAGMTDELTTTLAKIEALHVIAHQSVLRFRRSEQSVPEIARALGVRHVVHGSVLQVGDRVRITATLVDAATNAPVWADRFERDGRDVLMLRREVALAVARAVAVALTPADRERLADARPVDPDAFHLYIKGTQIRYGYGRPAGEGDPAHYFARAIAKDSTYAPAYAGLAFVQTMSGNEAGARALAERALALDPTLAEAHVVLGMIRQFIDRDWAGAEAAFREAIRLNPGYAEAHLELSMLLMRRRRFAEALQEAQRTLYLAPMSARFEIGAAEVYLYSGRYTEALTAADRALAVDSSNAGSYLVRAYAYGEQQRYEKAAEAATKCIALGWDVHGRARLGYVHAKSGRRAEALRIVDTLTARWREGKAGRTVPDVATGIAQVYVGLGDPRRALDWLERGVGTDSYLVYLGIDPTFRSLHAEPRFRALLKKMGLDE